MLFLGFMDGVVDTTEPATVGCSTDATCRDLDAIEYFTRTMADHMVKILQACQFDKMLVGEYDLHLMVNNGTDVGIRIQYGLNVFEILKIPEIPEKFWLQGI
jgi:hypothetical protein